MHKQKITMIVAIVIMIAILKFFFGELYHYLIISKNKEKKDRIYK